MRRNNSCRVAVDREGGGWGGVAGRGGNRGGGVFSSAGRILCPPLAVGVLVPAFSRPALDVGGLSAKRLGDLVEAGLVKTPVDLF